ncbi:MAG: GAF domain-containing protein [Chloroflexi bacterium]|nr:GAF domain-containing protein [Chloroflexota bacterium]MBU1751407.1 GAF domain-containing protein [Chloroflexota bacterium]MBU1879724.1 GAF domain-containing protein [Chloroflexota bacterium]
MLHRLLERQLNKFELDPATPADAAKWPRFLEQISQAYTESEQDRYLLERSLTISSAEMQELYEKLHQASETRLAQERDKLEAIIQSVGDGLCVLDPDENLSLMNPAAERLLGWPLDELQGQPVLQWILPPVLVEPLCDLIHAGQAYRDEDGRFSCQGKRTLAVSYVVNPMMHDGRYWGAVLVFRDIAERKKAQESLERRAAQLALLNDIGEKIAAVLDLDSVLDRAATLTQETFGYHHVALFTLDPERRELIMRARAGAFTDLFPTDHRLRLGQGLVGWVGQQGVTVLANDVQAEPRYVNLYPNRVPTRAEMSLPILVAGTIVGVLDIQSPQPQAFDETDLLVMGMLANQIAVAIENARLFEQAQRLTATVGELSAPVIQVWDQVLVLPLVGGIDETRSKRIMETLLEGITQHQAQVVILDVTGVPVIDSWVADHLLHTTRAAALLGAQCVLTGISPEIAQSIVSLGLPLTKLTTLPNLQAGIQHALTLLRRTK